ncbi:MAG: hypothetical protein AAF984_05215 [Verrucomicrobiota bacterium]
MTKEESIQVIKDACNEISTTLMKIHPALPGLNDEEIKSEIIKASFEATKNVETIKKKVNKLGS